MKKEMLIYENYNQKLGILLAGALNKESKERVIEHIRQLDWVLGHYKEMRVIENIVGDPIRL